jgi:hypothetical protein
MAAILVNEARISEVSTIKRAIFPIVLYRELSKFILSACRKLGDPPRFTIDNKDRRLLPSGFRIS